MSNRDITISRCVYDLETGLYYKIGSENPKQLPDGIVDLLTSFTTNEDEPTDSEIKNMMKIIFLFMDGNEHPESELLKQKYSDKDIYILYITMEQKICFYYHFKSKNLSFCKIRELLEWI